MNARQLIVDYNSSAESREKFFREVGQNNAFVVDGRAYFSWLDFSGKIRVDEAEYLGEIGWTYHTFMKMQISAGIYNHGKIGSVSYGRRIYKLCGTTVEEFNYLGDFS